MTGVAPSLVALLACWTVGSSLWVYPHSLSYFNESIGGPLKGAEHLLGSNVDWGQDIRYVLKRANSIDERYALQHIGFYHIGNLVDAYTKQLQTVSSGRELAEALTTEVRAGAISKNEIYKRSPILRDAMRILFQVQYITYSTAEMTRPD